MFSENALFFILSRNQDASTTQILALLCGFGE